MSEPVWRNAGTSVAFRASRALSLCSLTLLGRGRDDRQQRHRRNVKDTVKKTNMKAHSYQRVGAVPDCTRMQGTDLRSRGNVI